MPAQPKTVPGIRIAIGVALAVAALGGVLAFFVLPSFITSFRESSRRAVCGTKLKQIAHALVNYELQHGHFPPVASASQAGPTAMSWRVAILPFLEQTAVFRAYRSDEPWNSPTNREFGKVGRAIYRCPSDAGPPENTSYVMVAGPGSLGGLGNDTRTSSHVADKSGTALTILFLEVPDSGIHWMDPHDPTIDEILEKLGSNDRWIHGGSIAVAFCDGHVQFIRQNVPGDVIRALADPERDAPVDFSSLDQ